MKQGKKKKIKKNTEKRKRKREERLNTLYICQIFKFIRAYKHIIVYLKTV